MSADTRVEISVPADPPDHVLIGTGRHCHVRIVGDPAVLLEHASVHRERPGVFRVSGRSPLAPLRVLRGINEHRLGGGESMRLARGDTIVVGGTWLPWTADFR